jgi:hypothetical protein
MKKYFLSVIALIILIISPILGQSTPVEKGLEAITIDAIKAQLGFLSSDWMEGRMAGEKGEFMSADYIASLLQVYGVKPGGDLYQMANAANSPKSGERTYFQNFLLLKRAPGDEQIFKIRTTEGQTSRTINFTYNVDFAFRQTLPSAETEAPVVFVGYGFKSDKLKYNDLNKLDLKGKFILKLSGVPEFARRQLPMSEVVEAERALESLARSGEAAGIIEIYPNSLVVGPQARKEFINMSPAESNPRSSQSNVSYSIPGKSNPDNIPRIYVSVKTANVILKGTGIDLEDYIKKADSNLPYNLLPITGKMLYLKTTSVTSTVTVRNVLGIVEGNNPDQVMVLGAHYDHMGMSNGYIWNGADDNASGAVGVLTLAKAIMATGKKPGKTIIFAFWTAEEEGLLGSRYYVQNLIYPLKNLKMNLNYDMISRYINDNDPKKVTMTYTSSNTGFKDITEANRTKYGIDLVIDYQPSPEPPGGSDHRSFVSVGVPIMRFKPGHREEYHTPDDEFNTIDWDIMEKIIKISFTNVWELSNTEW